MATLDGNLFRQAKELLQSKSIFDMNEEELTTVNAAQIPLNMPEFNDMTTDEGLEELSKRFDGEKGDTPHMIYYRGFRHSKGQGHQLVTKDDDILDLTPSQKIWNHSPDGFNWSYQGSGPAQLALALLYDVTKDKDIAVRLHQEFKRDYVATWGDTWELTDAYIRGWVDSKRGAVKRR